MTIGLLAGIGLSVMEASSFVVGNALLSFLVLGEMMRMLQQIWLYRRGY